MKTLTIDMRNGQRYRASSKHTAIRIAKHNLGGVRIYRGAEYQTDRPIGRDEREYVMALDLWTDKKAARMEANTQADAVISW